MSSILKDVCYLGPPGNEELRKIKLEVGGEVSREAARVYAGAHKRRDSSLKHTALRAKAGGLIIQNPDSGWGWERTESRRLRFPSLTGFWEDRNPYRASGELGLDAYNRRIRYLNRVGSSLN